MLKPLAPLNPRALEQRARLRRAQVLATGAVVVAAAAALGAPMLPLPPFWRGLIGAAGEAGTVGGLADWFAVTALFRRPLGLPIPHTALIARRKDDIARSMARFVEEHFLDGDVLVARLKESDRALQLGRWLQTQEASQFVARRLREIFGALVKAGSHLDLVDAVLPFLKELNAELEGVLAQEVGKRTGRYVPAFVDKRLAGAGQTILDGIIEALGTPGAPERQALDGWIRARFAEIPAELQDAANVVWEGLRARADDTVPGASAQTEAAIAQLVRQAGAAISDSPQMRGWINGAVERAVVDYVVPWRAQIGRYIEDVVRRWDAREVSRIIELQVGRDLQFIRINGTVIGAAIGVALFLAGGLVG